MWSKLILKNYICYFKLTLLVFLAHSTQVVPVTSAVACWPPFKENRIFVQDGLQSKSFETFAK